MTIVVLAREEPRARKHHRCDNCQCSIAPGDVYYRERNIYDGIPYVWKTHIDCRDLATEIADERDYDPWEGIPPLCEEERETIEEYRGMYPHAVCRVELGWELARIRRERQRGEKK